MVSKRTISERTHEYACAHHVEEMKELALCSYILVPEINTPPDAPTQHLLYAEVHVLSNPPHLHIQNTHHILYAAA